ncbi:MAG: phage baseplate assembly protein V [Clostridia bacterium]|nr:phage baseplate assembly protein V [Clostridia bacterium]
MNAFSAGKNPIMGVISGRVLEIKDPEGLERVKVKIPLYTDDETGVWARIAVLMAGDNRGTYFLPEKGDEVLLAFEEGDIARPYVIGALWNGKHKPPSEKSDNKNSSDKKDDSENSNNKRLIKSRSGHILSFDDTKGAGKIEIIDETGKNSIVFDSKSNTITVTAEQDIIIKAPNGKITLSANEIEISSKSGTTVNAKGDANINGANIYLNC